MWRWGSCLGRRGSGSTGYSGGWRLGQQEYSALGGVAASIGQDAPVFLPRESSSLTEKPQSTGSQRFGQDQSDPVRVDERLSLACGSSAPVRAGHEAGAAVCLEGTLAAPSVQGHGLPLLQGLRPYQDLYSSFL